MNELNERTASVELSIDEMWTLLNEIKQYISITDYNDNVELRFSRSDVRVDFVYDTHIDRIIIENGGGSARYEKNWPSGNVESIEEWHR